MYPVELEIKYTTGSNTSASYLYKQIIQYRATATLRDRKYSNTLPQMRGRGTKPMERHIILTKYEVAHPRVVLENYSWSGMLTILIKVQTLSILSKFFAGRFIHIISKGNKERISKIEKKLKT